MLTLNKDDDDDEQEKQEKIGVASVCSFLLGEVSERGSFLLHRKVLKSLIEKGIIWCVLVSYFNNSIYTVAYYTTGVMLPWITIYCMQGVTPLYMM